MLRSLFPAAPLLIVAALLGATPARAAATRVHFVTNLGDFTIELAEERAPLTCANFLRYVREGHYTQTQVHRVVHDFVIQGGGLDANYAVKPTHEPVANESGNGLRNLRGAVGLARAAGPHSGDSQFYVNLGDNPDLDPLTSRWGYAVFGRVVEGMDVVDRIGQVPTGAAGTLKGDAPLQKIMIEKAEILPDGARAAPADSAAPAPAAPATPKN
jgi:cyclophilin family peptidyl-prolyl cis-trans isomerase